MNKTQSKKLGVVVARLQTDELHEWHTYLFDSVEKQSDHILLCLWTQSIMDGKISNNPLPFESRKKMVHEHYPPSKLTILSIEDVLGNDSQWSLHLDDVIKNFAQNTYDFVELFGSRDSFIKHYKGIFNCRELEQHGGFSATERRKEIAKEYPWNVDQRKWAIRATQNAFPTVYSVVDVAVFNEDCSRIRLARKTFQDKYCFIGGFVDPTDNDRQCAAYRELQEETGIVVDSIHSLKHIGSAKVPDARYKWTHHAVMSDLFYTHQQRGGRAQDDIAELLWFDYDNLTKDVFIPAHHWLFDLLTNQIPQKK